MVLNLKYVFSKCCAIVYIGVLLNSSAIQGKRYGKDRREKYYSPIDSGFHQELNNIRCVDYEGHVSGKSRWPYSCLLPASHLATGRLFDGTSSLPEREIAPPWFNITLFEEGQQFAKANSGHLLISHIYGLFCTNLFLDSKEILLFTGEFDTPGKAARRYSRIVNGILNWYRNMPPASDFPKFGEVARSIRGVRMAHRNITEAAEKRIFEQRQPLINPAIFKSRSANEDLWTAFREDVASSHIPYENRRFPIEYVLTEEERRPINQFIQAMTQFGFVGLPVLFPDRVGLTNATDHELYAFNHMWAVMAYCMGIRDEFNISLQPDLYIARRYFRDIFETFIEPALFQIDFFTKILIDPLLEGIMRLEAKMTPRVIVTRILRDILQIPAPSSTERLNSLEKLSLAGLSNNMNVNELLGTLVGENILSTAVKYKDIDILYSPRNKSAFSVT